MKLSRLKPITRSAYLGGALVGCVSLGFAQDAPSFNKLIQENQDLRKRLEALEAVAQKEGLLPSGEEPKLTTLKSLSESILSGFVTSSYFYDFSDPADNSPNGYLWNRRHNSFSLNKVKLTLASPAAERSGDVWDAGYRVSLIFGEDAPIVNTGGELQGLEVLREAYVDLNIPVGTGLNVKVGQLISLLNYESGDGGAVNANFSQGNQWFFTGNGPSAGVQLGYTFNEWLDLRVRAQNGLYTGAVDNNGFKTMMGSFGIKADSKTSVNLIGFGGREGASSSQWLTGGSLIASRQMTEKNNFTLATELDYFTVDTGPGSSDWWSMGLWASADFSAKFGAALRVDFIGDGEGAGTSGLLGFPVHTGQDLFSATLTLNLRPATNIKIQPEIRYDHTSLDGAYDGQDRITIGLGASYLF